MRSQLRRKPATLYFVSFMEEHRVFCWKIKHKIDLAAQRPNLLTGYHELSS